MSVEMSIELNPALIVGEALPAVDGFSSVSHLYVSMSDLIMEYVFYHPEFQSVSQNLEEVELQAIQAILGEVSVEEHFVSTLTHQVSNAVKPEHQTVRVSFSNADSYAFSSLLGGSVETAEVNPALGVRGVSRFASKAFGATFALECKVVKALQALDVHVEVVVPFVRTLSDAAKVIDLLAEQGLPRGLNGFKVHYTVDVPSSALLAERLLHYFDGAVINLENLAQFTLGIDRFSDQLEYLYDPENDAVVELINTVLNAASAVNKPVLLTSSNLPAYSKIQETIAEHNLEVVVTV